MTTEDQSIALYAVVYGNIQHTDDDLRTAFNRQEPSVIDGWKRLANQLGKLTTPATIQHVARNER